MIPQPSHQKGLLKGFRVVELASVLAGPSVGMFLAELGAQVIKVENPRTSGDVTRGWKLASEHTENSVSAYFSAVNWGKESVAIDLQTGEGLQIVKALVAKADIVLTNFKPGDAEKLGLTYNNLSSHNQRLIYGSITGFGPHDKRVGYDAVIQAEAGFTYLNGQPDGPPTKMPVALMDLLAAHQLKQGILTALLHRQMTGMGDHVGVSLLQAGMSALANQATNWLVGGEIPQRMGSAHPNIAPYGDILYTIDNQALVLAIGNDRQFRDFCRVLKAEGMSNDPNYQTNQLRVQNRPSLLAALRSQLGGWYAADLMQALESAGIPVGMVRNMQQVMESPQAKAMLMQEAGLEGLKQVAFEGTFSYHSASLGAPPSFAKHTKAILSQVLQYPDNDIDQLLRSNVVAGNNQYA